MQELPKGELSKIAGALYKEVVQEIPNSFLSPNCAARVHTTEILGGLLVGATAGLDLNNLDQIV